MPSDDSAGAAQVTADSGTNRFYGWYLGGLAVVGTLLIILGVKDVLGIWAAWVGGFLVLSGVSGILGMLKTGGAGKLACPSCGASIEVLHISEARVIRCSGCGVFLEGAKQMQVVPPDRIDRHTVFQARLPEPFVWPEGCPVCGGPTTRTVPVEGMSGVGHLARMVSPVSVVRVSKVNAPCCEAHADGVGISRDGDQTVIGFRSIAYWRRFCEANGIETGPQNAR